MTGEKYPLAFHQSKNTFASFFITGLILLVFPACTPSSIHPLSSPEQSFADKALLGSWEIKSQKESLILRFKPAKNSGQLMVEFIERKLGREGEPGKDDKKSFQVFSTRINGKTIATIKAPPEPDSKEPYRSARYSFAWYVIEANHKLFVRFLSNEETALDVKAGEIKGEVTKLEFGGNDVILTDDTFTLHRWIEGGDIQKMFSDPVSVDLIKEAGPFLRVDSIQE